MAKEFLPHISKYFNDYAHIYRSEIGWAGVACIGLGFTSSVAGMYLGGSEGSHLFISGITGQYLGMNLTNIESKLEVYK